jgi:hypothetical protein
MTIDHTKVALDLLSTANDMSFSELKDRLTATAQVHATLAAAEQARIANLLAVLNGDSDLMVEGWGTATHSHVVRRIQNKNVLREQISEGLGI